MAQAFNPSTQESEVRVSLRVQGQSGLQSEFKDSQGYTEKPCLKKETCKQANKQTKKDEFSYFIFMNVLPAHTCASHACFGALWGQKRLSEPPGLELQM